MFFSLWPNIPVFINPNLKKVSRVIEKMSSLRGGGHRTIEALPTYLSS